MSRTLTTTSAADMVGHFLEVINGETEGQKDLNPNKLTLKSVLLTTKLYS